ncbi:EpsG family protein [Lachnospiraceae bacterium 62-26]
MSVNETYQFYLLIITSSFIITLFSETKNRFLFSILIKNNKKVNINIISIMMKAAAFIILLIPLVNRTCGADTYTYYRTYVSNNVKGLDFWFYLLCKVLHKLIPEAKIGLGIISFFTLLIVFIAFESVKKEIEIKYSFLAYYTSLYFYLYNYVRMMLAVSFIILGYSFIVKDKKKCAIVSMIVAACFHRSAILVLAMYLVLINFVKYKKIIISSGIVGVIIFVNNPSFFLSLISIERYSAHISISVVQESSIGLGTFIRVLPIILILLYYSNHFKGNMMYNLLIVSTFANLAISYLGYYVAVASRLANVYFVFHLLYAVPWLLRQSIVQKDKYKIIVVFIFYCGLNYYLISQNFEAMMIVPYE